VAGAERLVFDPPYLEEDTLSARNATGANAPSP
jgi:hypothetical protein